MEEINYDKVRDPCEYCGKKHIDYACDAQLAFLEIAIKDDSIKLSFAGYHDEGEE